MSEQNWIIRNPWVVLNAEETRKAYAEVASVSGRGDRYRLLPQGGCHDFYKGPTRAHSYGSYCLDMHQVYEQILELLKTNREWQAGRVHSTYHVSSPWMDVDDEHDALIYRLDPWLVNHPWFDSTTGATDPNSWPVPLEPDDLDDSVFFYCPEKKWLMKSEIGTEESIHTFEFIGEGFSELAAKTIHSPILTRLSR